MGRTGRATGADTDSDDDDGIDCVICTCNVALVGREYMLTPCNHIFHCTCIKTWLLQNNSCPVCRSAIPDDFAEIESEADKGESESSEREASEGDDVALPGISTDQTSTREEETEPREENVHNVQAQVTVP